MFYGRTAIRMVPALEDDRTIENQGEPELTWANSFKAEIRLWGNKCPESTANRTMTCIGMIIPGFEFSVQR